MEHGVEDGPIKAKHTGTASQYHIIKVGCHKINYKRKSEQCVQIVDHQEQR